MLVGQAKSATNTLRRIKPSRMEEYLGTGKGGTHPPHYFSEYFLQYLQWPPAIGGTIGGTRWSHREYCQGWGTRQRFSFIRRSRWWVNSWPRKCGSRGNMHQKARVPSVWLCPKDTTSLTTAQTVVIKFLNGSVCYISVSQIVGCDLIVGGLWNWSRQRKCIAILEMWLGFEP